MLSRMLYASCAISKIAVLIIASLVVFPEGVRADEFSRIAGPFVSELMRRPDAHSHESLTIRQLESLPEVLPRVRTALLIVKTDEGNLAKLLVTPGLRKGKPGPTPLPLVPVLVVERFETLEASSYWSLKAHGKEIVLFGEFPFDLDSGQVVPEGMGGDILFTSAGGNGPRLLALGESRIYTFDRPVLPPAVAPGRPSSGRVVEAGDFTGSYHLIANGQWSGCSKSRSRKAEKSPAASAPTPVDRSIPYAARSPPANRNELVSPSSSRAEQVYDGLLWTEGKNVLAGTFTMLERPYSFVAVRDAPRWPPRKSRSNPRRT